MFYSYKIATSEFADLCQSQMRLLDRGLGAIWSAVYLTEGLGDKDYTNLFPFAIYPDNRDKLSGEVSLGELPEILQQVTSSSSKSSRLLLSESIAENNDPRSEEKKDNFVSKQLVLPLIYETAVLGLLITGREDREWNQQELIQVEAIARTLAIARFLECQSQWYREELTRQKNYNRWEKDRFEDLLHQIRNPLTALRTFSKLLLKRFAGKSRDRDIAESIIRESDRLNNLLQQFKQEQDRVNNEEVSVTLSTKSLPFYSNEKASNFLLPDKTASLDLVEIHSVLEPLLITIKEIALEKKIELIVNVPQKLPKVKADISGLREVLNNLLDNGIKYTPSGGKIIIDIQQNKNLLGIVIQDTGYGIPLEVQDRIFERHYRGIQEEGDIPGTGLGLSIAKELVEQMQGDIELISPNHISNNPNFPGTTFTIWLLKNKPIV